VWSLGVVFWELLTGARLFHREREVDTIRAVLQAPIPAPSSARPGVPREFDEIVMHALQRDPARRFATARDLSLAIENVRGRRESTVGHGMLAAWLRQLFPDLYARRLELVDQARQMDEGSVPKISRALSESSIDTRRVVEPLGDADSVRLPRTRLVFAAALLLALLLALAGFALWPEAPAPASDAPRAVAPASTADPENTPGPARALPAREPPPSEPAQPPSDQLAAIDSPTPTPNAQDAEGSEPVLESPAGDNRSRATGRGFVNVATPGGWADVYVGGKHRGRTPVQITIASGRRVVVLRPFGGKPLRRNVLVRRDQLTRLVVPVRRPPGLAASP
jgi:serine/threonine-protein kinase